MLTKITDVNGETHLVNLDEVHSIHPLKVKPGSKAASLIVVANGSVSVPGTTEEVAEQYGLESGAVKVVGRLADQRGDSNTGDRTGGGKTR